MFCVAVETPSPFPFQLTLLPTPPPPGPTSSLLLRRPGLQRIRRIVLPSGSSLMGRHGWVTRQQQLTGPGPVLCVAVETPSSFPFQLTLLPPPPPPTSSLLLLGPRLQLIVLPSGSSLFESLMGRHDWVTRQQKLIWPGPAFCGTRKAGGSDAGGGAGVFPGPLTPRPGESTCWRSHRRL